MSSEENLPEPDTSESPFYLRKTFLGAAVFLAGIIAAGVYVVWPGQNTGNPSQQGTPIGSGATTQPGISMPREDEQDQEQEESPTAVESACGLDSGDTQVPERIESEPLEVGRNLTVPSVPGNGPGMTDEITWCFAPNPTGAILAAANWMIWSSSQQQLPEVADLLLLDDATGQAAREQIREHWDGQTWSPVTIVGFSYEDLGEDQALVTLAASTVQRPDVIAAFPLPMIFHHGDWKLVAPPSGSWGERGVVDLVGEGFTEWRP